MRRELAWLGLLAVPNQLRIRIPSQEVFLKESDGALFSFPRINRPVYFLAPSHNKSYVSSPLFVA